MALAANGCSHKVVFCRLLEDRLSEKDASLQWTALGSQAMAPALLLLADSLSDPSSQPGLEARTRSTQLTAPTLEGDLALLCELRTLC